VYGNVTEVTRVDQHRRTLPWIALGVVYVLWGSTYLANRYIIVSMPPLLASGFRFMTGGLLLGLLVLVFAGPRAFAMTRAQLGTAALSGLLLPAWGNGLVILADIAPVSWWAWLYMSLFVSLGAFSAYAYALATLPVSTVATYAYVNPVIAVLLGVVVAGERFSVLQLAGGAIVLVAVVMVIAAERPARHNPAVGDPARPTPRAAG
jgi:drug/metabolite transporter (DMT)-like permease